MVIDDQGQQLGDMETYRAMQMARERDLDLVEVSPIAHPPVCKIMDYGAYQYQQEKKERKQKAKQKKVEIKGIRLGLNIGAHDLEIRKNQALKFFEKGDKVKVELILRGRERAFVDRARTIMEDFAKSLGDNAVIEQPLTRQGGRLSLLVARR
jgi:translation initiation factor IF-3